MRRILEILTPENVYVEYELAGLGSRFAALIIDSLIQIALMLIVIISMFVSGYDFDGVWGAYNSLFIAAGIAILFLINFGYFIFFEMISHGQSPGKKAMKLRVIKENGQPVGFYESVLRNTLRIADMLPLLNLLGAVFITFSKNYKRVGDFAANTIVVKNERETKPMGLNELLEDVSEKQNENVNLSCSKIYPVDNFEYGILREFLSRKGNLGKRRPVFAYHLNMYFMKKFNIEKPYTDPYAFFEEILRMNSGVY